MYEDKNIIFFDGLCNLCNSFIDFVIKRNHKRNIYYSSLQSDFAKDFIRKKNIKLENIDTIYFFFKGNIYTKHKAFSLILLNLPLHYKIFSFLFYVPNFIGYGAYDFVAKRRYKWFGKRNSCRVPSLNEKNMFLD